MHILRTWLLRRWCFWHPVRLDFPSSLSSATSYTRIRICRIENVMAVREAKTRGQFPKGQKYFSFEQLTFVPIQKKLIDVELLSKEEISYLDGESLLSVSPLIAIPEYHQECREKVSPLLSGATLKWLEDSTKPL